MSSLAVISSAVKCQSSNELQLSLDKFDDAIWAGMVGAQLEAFGPTPPAAELVITGVDHLNQYLYVTPASTAAVQHGYVLYWKPLHKNLVYQHPLAKSPNPPTTPINKTLSALNQFNYEPLITILEGTSAMCECGAASVGVGNHSPGHSSWCPAK